jgi:SAM-dependent MidA family methyltransferase
MDKSLHTVESFQLFSESLIWQLNRDYYQEIGIEAWSEGEVPHQITSNSLVGKTYSELILGFLKDLAAKGQTKETVYIIELGAGHGRLAYHILKHLEKLIALDNSELPPFCYVLSDIVEKNLHFFKNHTQFQSYFKKGILDYAYYDAIDGKDLHLRYADLHIKAGELQQPLLAIANYFFDSIPNDLFHIKEKELSVCSIALHSEEHPLMQKTDILLENIELTYREKAVEDSYYSSIVLDEMLEDYRLKLTESYFFFPEKSILCLKNLKELSSKGLMLLSMDKGYHNIANINNRNKPEIITHGSFSVWVNYNALGSNCQKTGGKILFPSYSTFHLQVGCLLFLENADSYSCTNGAYQRYVNDFGPDDYNSIKKLAYANISKLTLIDLLALTRLSFYDSTMFLKIIPRIKRMAKSITHEERERLAQTLHLVWGLYFNINESEDLALTIAGIFFDLGYYEFALEFYQNSTDVYGVEADTCYNKALCYYQLRQDVLFKGLLKEAGQLFPDSDVFDSLHKLDLSAV